MADGMRVKVGMDATAVHGELDKVSERIATLRAERDALAPVKPGVQSSELWVVLAAMALVALRGTLGMDAESVWAILGIAGVYAGGRSYVKSK